MNELSFEKYVRNGVDPFLQFCLQTKKIRTLRLLRAHFFNLEWYSEFMEYWKKIAKKDALGTRSVALNAVVFVCKYLVRDDGHHRDTREWEVIRAISQMSWDLQKQRGIDLQRLKEDDDANYVPFDDLVGCHTAYRAKWQAMPNKTTKQKRARAKVGFRYILMGFFFRVAVVRPGSLRLLSLKKFTEDGKRSPQFLDLSKKNKAFLEYRGSGSYKTRKFGTDMRVEVADQEFARDLHDYADEDRKVLLDGATCDTFFMGVNSRKTLATETLGEHIKNGLKEICGGHMGPRLLRHIAITDLLSDESMTYTQLDAVAKVMQNSVRTMKRSYDLRNSSKIAQMGVAVLHARRSSTRKRGAEATEGRVPSKRQRRS